MEAGRLDDAQFRHGVGITLDAVILGDVYDLPRLGDAAFLAGLDADYVDRILAAVL